MPPRKRRTTRKSTTTRKTPTRAAKPAPIPPVVGPDERLFILSVPFEERGVANANGARWDPYHRQTIFVGATLPYGLTPYASPDYSWERYVEDDLNGTVQPTQPSSMRFTPRPHQIEAVTKIANTAARGYRGFLEADDVGVGKTISAWLGAVEVAKQRGARSVLVMCPKGVIPHWRRTIAALGDHGLRVVVINYDQAKKLLTVPDSAATAARTRTKNKQIATKGQPVVDWDIVLADESHKLKNQSQRRNAFSRIARYAATAKTAPFVIWMSATAGQNPTELGYLAPLFAQLTGASKTELKDFGQWLADQGFCVTYNARFDKWDWGLIPEDAAPAEVAQIAAHRERDLTKIHSMLFAGDTAPSIRRLPTDIAGWPEVQRIAHPVELDRDQRRLYEEAWTAFRADMKLFARGRDPKGGMAARLRFRQKASLIRVPGTVELVLDMLDNGHQVAVSVEFHETSDAIRAALEAAKVPVAEFSGRNTDTREAERLAFQRGQRKVMLFSATEAISLHQGEQLPDGTHATDTPRTTIVHDPRYSGLDSIQIEGRCVLEGQYVQTGRGAIPIEEVKIGDEVLTHLGNMRPVTDVWSRTASASAGSRGQSKRRLITTLTYEGHPSLEVTHDHELWIRGRDGQVRWAEAHQVLPGDALATPRSADVSAVKALRFPDEHRRYSPEHIAMQATCADGCAEKVVARNRCQNHYRTYVRSMRKQGIPLPVLDRSRIVNGRYLPAPPEVPVDEAFLRFAGWYLAEGCATVKDSGVGKAISLSGHADERSVLQGHGSYLERTFGMQWKIFDREESNGIELKAWGCDLANWFHADFGHMAVNKHLPSWFWSLSRDQQRTMLWSYFDGDGSVREDRNGKDLVGWGTSSPRLHSELVRAVAHLGYKASTWSAASKDNASIRGRAVRQREHFYGEFLLAHGNGRRVIEDDYIWRPVREVTTRAMKNGERVWDLTVAEDQSYVVGAAAVHNCHRDGMTANVYYTFGAGTVEEQIVRTLVGRVLSTKAMAGDDVTSVRELEAVLEDAALGGADDPYGGDPISGLTAASPAAAGQPRASTPAPPAGGGVPTRRPATVRQPSGTLPTAAPPVGRSRTAQPAPRAAAPARRTRPATDASMTPEERAFREALAGGKIGPKKKPPTAADRQAFRNSLRDS